MEGLSVPYGVAGDVAPQGLKDLGVDEEAEAVGPVGDPGATDDEDGDDDDNDNGDANTTGNAGREPPPHPQPHDDGGDDELYSPDNDVDDQPGVTGETNNGDIDDILDMIDDSDVEPHGKRWVGPSFRA